MSVEEPVAAVLVVIGEVWQPSVVLVDPFPFVGGRVRAVACARERRAIRRVEGPVNRARVGLDVLRPDAQRPKRHGLPCNSPLGVRIVGVREQWRDENGFDVVVPIANVVNLVVHFVEEREPLHRRPREGVGRWQRLIINKGGYRFRDVKLVFNVPPNEHEEHKGKDERNVNGEVPQ